MRGAVDRVRAVDLRLEIRGRELVAATQRAAVLLRPPDDGLLRGHGPSIPVLDQDRDLADDQVRAAGEPAGALAGGSQTCWSITASFASRMLLEPSLKPMRLRGVCWTGGRHRRCARNPSATSGSPRGPIAIRDRLRIACTATCGSSAQTWTPRSPSLQCRLQSVAGERRQAFAVPVVVPQRCEAVDSVTLEQPRSHPDRDGQTARRQTQGFSRVVARRVRVAPARAPADGSAAPGSCRPLHPTSRASRFVRSRRLAPSSMSKREMDVVLGGVETPA